MYFTIQDPAKQAPTRKEQPTYKVDSFLKHLQIVSMSAWMLGRDISGDEEMIGFQGQHADKLHITYKAEEDGFQCDALADAGFTWKFYFCNQPVPEKWTTLGYFCCIPVFWECLIKWRRNTTIVGSTTCTCLQSLQRQHTSTPTKSKSLGLLGKVGRAFQSVSYKKR